MTYKFIGTPDIMFPFLKKGKIYNLTIEEFWHSRGVFSGNAAPRIITPFTCPYSSWEMFYQNWERIA